TIRGQRAAPRGTTGWSPMVVRPMHRRLRTLPCAALLPAIAALLVAADARAQERRELRVCADPNNLPYSNERQEGFENKIAELIARELGATLSYTWWPQRRGFVRNTLREQKCDLVMGVP